MLNKRRETTLPCFHSSTDNRDTSTTEFEQMESWRPPRAYNSTDWEQQNPRKIKITLIELVDYQLMSQRARETSFNQIRSITEENHSENHQVAKSSQTEGAEVTQNPNELKGGENPIPRRGLEFQHGTGVHSIHNQCTLPQKPINWAEIKNQIISIRNLVNINIHWRYNNRWKGMTVGPCGLAPSHCFLYVHSITFSLFFLPFLCYPK